MWYLQRSLVYFIPHKIIFRLVDCNDEHTLYNKRSIWKDVNHCHDSAFHLRSNQLKSTEDGKNIDKYILFWVSKYIFTEGGFEPPDIHIGVLSIPMTGSLQNYQYITCVGTSRTCRIFPNDFIFCRLYPFIRICHFLLSISMYLYPHLYLVFKVSLLNSNMLFLIFLPHVNWFLNIYIFILIIISIYFQSLPFIILYLFVKDTFPILRLD